MSAECKNPKKKEGFFISHHLALGPDCGAGCIEVYGRGMEKHTKTKHIYDFWWKNAFRKKKDIRLNKIRKS